MDVLKSNLKHIQCTTDEKDMIHYCKTYTKTPSKLEDHISNKITLLTVDHDYLQYIRKKKIIPRKLSDTELTIVDHLLSKQCDVELNNPALISMREALKDYKKMHDLEFRQTELKIQLLEERLSSQVKINAKLSNEVNKSAAFIEKLTEMLKRKRIKDIPDVPRLSVFDENDTSSIKCLEASLLQIEGLAKEIHKHLSNGVKLAERELPAISHIPHSNDDLPSGFDLSLHSGDVNLIIGIYLE